MSPSFDLAAGCRAFAPPLGDVESSLKRATGGIITEAEALQSLKQDQASMDDLATAYPDARVQAAGHRVADDVGRVRVALGQGGNVSASFRSFTPDSEAFVAACHAAINTS